MSSAVSVTVTSSTEPAPLSPDSARRSPASAARPSIAVVLKEMTIAGVESLDSAATAIVGAAGATESRAIDWAVLISVTLSAD